MGKFQGSNKTQLQLLRVWNYIMSKFEPESYDLDGFFKDVAVSCDLHAIRRIVDVEGTDESRMVLTICFYNIDIDLYIDSDGSTRLILDLPSHIDIRDFDMDRLLRDIWIEIRKSENNLCKENI